METNGVVINIQFMGSGYTILMVEDNDDDVFLLERAFRMNGIRYPIQRARDGLEAIEYLQGKGNYADRGKFPSPELLIIDLKMPRMSGLELLQWLGAHPEYQVIPTIVMSTSQQPEDVRTAYQLGANTYFVKPSQMTELAQLVQSVHDYWASSTKPGSK